MRYPLILAVISALPLVGCDSKESNIRVALEWARLSPLPVPDNEVKVANIGNSFARRIYIKFHATPQQINKWIAESPSIKGKEPIVHTAKRKYLSGEEWDNVRMQDNSPHDFFYLPKELQWFDPTLDDQGRRYEIEQNSDAEYGTIVIDDEKCIVYITASYS